MSSFPFVQVAAGVNSSSRTFASNSTPGNIIVAMWGGVKSGFAAGATPATCTDNNGNVYRRASGYIENQLGVVIFVAVNIAAAVPHQPVTVTFGAVSGLITQSPSVIIAEYGPPPGNYQVFGLDCQGNAAGLVRFLFGQLQGLTTGSVDIQFSRTGGNSDQVAGVLLMNQFQDAVLVCADYCQGIGATGFTVSPGTVRASTHEVTGALYDDSGALADSDFTLASGCGSSASTLGIACGAVPNGTIGTAYSYTFHGTGGYPPYTYAITSGSLPTGLTLNASTGVVSGTPSADGTFTFDITVTDSVGSTASASCSITIGGCTAGSSNYGWTG